MIQDRISGRQVGGAGDISSDICLHQSPVCIMNRCLLICFISCGEIVHLVFELDHRTDIRTDILR